MLLLESRYDLALQDVNGVAVEVVPLAELAAARVWVSNWSRMLPVINATQSLLPKGLVKRVCDRIQEPTPLAHVERDLAVGDPAIDVPLGRDLAGASRLTPVSTLLCSTTVELLAGVAQLSSLRRDADG